MGRTVEDKMELDQVSGALKYRRLTSAPRTQRGQTNRLTRTVADDKL